MVYTIPSLSAIVSEIEGLEVLVLWGRRPPALWKQTPWKIVGTNQT